ncbi:hypothetical protein A3D14_01640 [Candidatus Saccharibacteria bacterium RIFCSPHIGHO2_02_FULL_47_12]|nr:MAG: hypothetical protein A3D14_01640 [Candidatus Saccharibacteria bacterium RIFCSPHIGHO2_02_FULL_47_12]
MSRESLYFAYGERTPQVMGAIIGRVPEYEAAALTGFQLCIQHIVDIPETVQDILAVNRSKREIEEFRAYVAAPSADKYVPGLVFRGVTYEELDILDNWDIEGLWFKRHQDQPVQIVNHDYDATTRLGMADTHADPQGDLTVVNAPFEGVFPPALNNPQRIMEIARIAREEFLSGR